MSATQGAWECRHGVDGRDWCDECHAAATATLDTSPTAPVWKRVLVKLNPDYPPTWKQIVGRVRVLGWSLMLGREW